MQIFVSLSSGRSGPSDEVGGGGGAGHPDPEPEIRGGAVSKKNCLRPFGPQFHLKIRGASSPGSVTA